MCCFFFFVFFFWNVLTVRVVEEGHSVLRAANHARCWSSSHLANAKAFGTVVGISAGFSCVKHRAGGPSRSSKFLTSRGNGKGASCNTNAENRISMSCPYVQRTIEFGTGCPASNAFKSASWTNVSRAVSTAHCGRPAELMCQPCCADCARYVWRC